MKRLPSQGRRASAPRGFTLVEILVALAILIIIMLFVSQMVGSISKLWKTTSNKIDSFRDARLAFQLMTDELSQATTNTYWDYFDGNGYYAYQYYNNKSPAAITPFAPYTYGRQSELHFMSGPCVDTAQNQRYSLFGATNPLTQGTPFTQGVFFVWPGNYTTSATYSSLNSLLNATGFFVEFSPDVLPGNIAYVANGPPTSLLTAYQPKYRFRLMQFVQPSESLAVYKYSFVDPAQAVPQSNAPTDWFRLPIINSHKTSVRIVADNIIALFIWPKATDSPTDTLTTLLTARTYPYVYDSRLGLFSDKQAWTPKTTPSQWLMMNQAPPILRIAMVALDEPSAAILQGTSTTLPASITNILSATSPSTLNAMNTTVTPNTRIFTNPQNMDSDIAFLQTQLAAITPKLNFHVFETTIAVRSAKFSTQ